jgi:hypothetical protein
LLLLHRHPLVLVHGVAGDQEGEHLLHPRVVGHLPAEVDVSVAIFVLEPA